MTNKIATIYTKELKRTDIYSSGQWSINLSLNFLQLLINPSRGERTCLVSEKLLPGNRFRFIQQINKKMLTILVRRIVKKAQPHILWIYNTEFYNIHNNSKTNILVLSCDKKYLHNNTPQMCYRELFAAGWVFAYILEETPKPLIFKNKTQAEVVAKITTLYF